MSIVDKIRAGAPADRDRYLDALRVVSIVLVILGHWLVRAATEGSDGEIGAGYMLALVPETQWGTLIVQVLPVFFFVGGALSAASYRRARARGDPPAAWIRARARRLLRPALPLVLLWVPLASLAEAAGDGDPTVFGADTALTPLWFLAAYLVVTALTPLTLRVHERSGGAALIVGGTALAVGIDLLRFELWPSGPAIAGQPAIAALNYPIVFAVVHQLGYLWADDELPRSRAGQLLWTLASAGILALMIAGAYPLTMVPISGEDAPNNLAPPSAALIALGGVQLGLALLARSAALPLLERPRVFAAVALPGSRLMTLYLWHQAAMVAAAAAVLATGLWPAAPAIDAAWWATRPLWIACCAGFLLALVAVFGRFESPPAGESPPPAGRRAAAATAAGVLLTAAGLASLAGSAPDPNAGWLALAPVAALFVGAYVLGVLTGTPAASGARDEDGGHPRAGLS